MGSGCPPASSMRSIAFFPWKVTKNTTVTKTSDATYTLSSASNSAKFNTVVNVPGSGRGFAPMAIARVSSDFCVSFSLQIRYLGGTAVQDSKELMAGIAIFDSKMNMIYEAGLKAQLPGIFETFPNEGSGMLPVNLNSPPINLRIGFSQGTVTFHNGKSDKLHSTDLSTNSVTYVALIMRGEGHYSAEFSNVKCAGLTAMSTSPAPSPIPKNEYLKLTNVSTDAEILGSGEVDGVAECKKVCDDTENCTGFDIVTNTNFCTLRNITTPLQENDAYTDDDMSKWNLAYTASINLTTQLNTISSPILLDQAIKVMLIDYAGTITGYIWDILENTDTYAEYSTTVASLKTKKSDFDTYYIRLSQTVKNSLQSYLNEVNNALAAAYESVIYIPLTQDAGANGTKIAFDSTGTYMAVCNDTSTLRIYKNKTLTNTLTYYSNYKITYVIFDNENNIIVSTKNTDTTITNYHGIQKFIRNVVDGTYPSTPTSYKINRTDGVTKMALSKNGEYMVTHSKPPFGNGTIQILKKQADGTFAVDSGMYNNILNNPRMGLQLNVITNITDISISSDGKFVTDVGNTGNIPVIFCYNPIDNTFWYVVSVNPPIDRIQYEFDPSNSDVVFILCTRKIIVCTKSGTKYEISLPAVAVHMSFDPSGLYLAVACTDGKLYVLRKQGNLKFIYSKSFNTTIELGYTLPDNSAVMNAHSAIANALISGTAASLQTARAVLNTALTQYNQEVQNIRVCFNPKTRGLAICSSNQIKIFKKLTSEEPTRFQSPSPRGVDTYVKLDVDIFEKIHFNFTIERSDPRGGGLKDVLKAIPQEQASPPAQPKPPKPVLNVSTLILDFASGRPECFIIDETKQRTYYATISYKAITYPNSTETPVFAFAISIEIDNRNIKTFYILTNTITFKSFTILNDVSEDVFNLPDNQTAAPRKTDFSATMTAVKSSISGFNWYRQNILSEIGLSEQANYTPDHIRYNISTKTLDFTSGGTTKNIQCDMLFGNHKITFKTNSGTSPVSPSISTGQAIAVFFVYDEDTIFLSYIHPSYQTVFNIKTYTNGNKPKVEENIAFTRDNSIDTPFYYIETKLNDPTNPYLEIDDMVNRALNYFNNRDNESLFDFIPKYEEFLLYRKRFTSTGSAGQTSIFFKDDQYLIINGNTSRPVRYFIYNGIVIFRDKYGTVYTIVFKEKNPQTYTELRLFINANYDTTGSTKLIYTLDPSKTQIKSEYTTTSMISDTVVELKMKFKLSSIPTMIEYTTTYQYGAQTYMETNFIGLNINSLVNFQTIHGINGAAFPNLMTDDAIILKATFYELGTHTQIHSDTYLIYDTISNIMYVINGTIMGTFT
jgi:hypothetical protein